MILAASRVPHFCINKGENAETYSILHQRGFIDGVVFRKTVWNRISWDEKKTTKVMVQDVNVERVRRYSFMFWRDVVGM